VLRFAEKYSLCSIIKIASPEIKLVLLIMNQSIGMNIISRIHDIDQINEIHLYRIKKRQCSQNDYATNIRNIKVLLIHLILSPMKSNLIFMIIFNV